MLIKSFLLRVEVLVPIQEMDSDDLEYWGHVWVRYIPIKAYNKNHAVDAFHNAYPIACLDDFKVGVFETDIF